MSAVFEPGVLDSVINASYLDIPLSSAGIDGARNAATKSYNFLTGVLSADFTFARASNASYFNSVGLQAQAAANNLRFDYDPITLAIRGALLEAQATDSIPYSSDFTQWALLGAAITPGYGTAPDGTGNATRMASSAPGTTMINAIYTTTTADIVKCIDVKPITGVWCGLTINGGAQLDGAFFNLSTGTIGTVAAGVSAQIKPLAGGWFRISIGVPTAHTIIAFQSASADNQAFSYLNGTEDYLIYQADSASVLSSPIPTSGLAATRLADSLINTSIPWFNAASGTFVCEFITPQVVLPGQVLAAFSDGTANNEFIIYAGYAAGTAAIGSVSAGVSSLSAPFLISANSKHKIAFAYDASSMYGAMDGVSVGTITGATLPTGINKLQLGSNFGGCFRKFDYYNTKYSPTKLFGIST